MWDYESVIWFWFLFWFWSSKIVFFFGFSDFPRGKTSKTIHLQIENKTFNCDFFCDKTACHRQSVGFFFELYSFCFNIEKKERKFKCPDSIHMLTSFPLNYLFFEFTFIQTILVYDLVSLIIICIRFVNRNMLGNRK